MKVGRYLEIMSNIDTDDTMDEKIKNKLLYYNDEKEEIVATYHRKKEQDRKGDKVFYHIFNKVSILRQVLPSLAFLGLLVVVILSVRASLWKETVAPSSQVDTIKDTNSDYNVASNEVFDNRSDHAQITPFDQLESESQLIEEEQVTPDKEVDLDLDIVSEDIVNSVSKNESNLNLSNYLNPTTEEPILPEATTSTEEITSNISSMDDIKMEEEASDTDDLIGDKRTTNKDATYGDFYFAWFDVTAQNGVKSAIPNLIIRLHGTVDLIDPADLTDLILTRDGAPVLNSLTLTNQVVQFTWNYEEVTDFYFAFDEPNMEPGTYGLTGKYKDETFEVYSKMIEASISEEAADPKDLSYVTFMGYMDQENNMIELTELVIGFHGRQNTLYQADITELQITRNNEVIDFKIHDNVTRYCEVIDNNNVETSYNLILVTSLTEPGDYVISGKYKGVSFNSCIITVK